MRENESISAESLPDNCDAFYVNNVVWAGLYPVNGKKPIPYTKECYSYDLDARTEEVKRKRRIKNEAN